MKKGEIFKEIHLFFNHEKKIFVVGDDNKKDTAIAWAGSDTFITMKNDPFTATIEDYEERYGGGRAWKIKWATCVVDLREDELLFCMRDKGIGPGGKILNELVWGRSGSQTKVIAVGSPLYNEIITYSKVKNNKVKFNKLVIGDVILNGNVQQKVIRKLSNGNLVLYTPSYAYFYSISKSSRQFIVIKNEPVTKEEDLGLDNCIQTGSFIA